MLSKAYIGCVEELLCTQVKACDAHHWLTFDATKSLHCMQVLTTQLAAKRNGYADVVYLDAKTDTYLEEVSSCNIFIVKGKKLKTPALQASPPPTVILCSAGVMCRTCHWKVLSHSSAQSHAACKTSRSDWQVHEAQPYWQTLCAVAQLQIQVGPPTTDQTQNC